MVGSVHFRLRRWIAVCGAVAAFALSACDSSGRAYEDLRLARLTEGKSTEQEVRQLFGEPAAVRDVAGGKGLVYPLGPEGPHTLLMKIGADGKYLGREDLLARSNLDRITPGMKERDVLVALGRPGHAQKYPLKRQTTWQWRFNDRVDTRMFVVTFDESGTVVSTAVEEDPRRFGGR